MSATLNHVLSDPNWAANRIEALEAALWDIMMDVEVTPSIREFARAALLPEQDK